MTKYREKHHWFYALGAAVIVFLSFSFEARNTLQTNPPDEYFANPLLEDRSRTIGVEYWKCARNHIQLRYHYGTLLPDDPPPEFQIDTDTERNISPERRRQIRLDYWAHLRRIWLRPEAWHNTYGLGFSWIGRALDRFKNYMQSLGPTLRGWF